MTVVVKYPDSTKASLQHRLTDRARERWPQLERVVLHHHGTFSYIDGILHDGTTLELARLRYGGSAHQWGLAIYRGLHLGDPTVWT